MPAVELLVIGNEILSGATLDTNSQWLARRLTAMGAHVGRRTTVSDEPKEIGGAVRGTLDRGAAVLITTGGLGPTFDDLTLEAVGAAVGRPARERADALTFIERRYRELYEAGDVNTPELLPPRRKMAAVPNGAELIANTVGTAPGIVLDVSGCCICCFPGVPRELHAMFDEENVQAALRRRVGARVVREVELLTPHNDESVLGPICDAVMAQVPDVYLKSRASTFAHTTRIPVLLTAAGSDAAEVEARLERARAKLAAACGLSDAGGPVGEPAG